MGLDMYLYAERPVPGIAPGVLMDDDNYVSAYEFSPEESKIAYRELVGAAGLASAADPETPSAFVEKGDPPLAQVTVAYWRKANAIHDWFVRECQDGVDECQMSEPISREKLTELRTLCEKVLERSMLIDGIIRNGQRGSRNEETGEFEWIDILVDGQKVDDPSVAQELLPTASGFFFGSTDYDQWYVADLKNTVEQIDRALRECPDDTVFRYRSSW